MTEFRPLVAHDTLIMRIEWPKKLLACQCAVPEVLITRPVHNVYIIANKHHIVKHLTE